MTATQDATIAELQRTIAELRQERDAGLAREATLAEALAQRNSEFGERIEQQSATIDVLKVMSASPGDAQPVFELIVERARAFCGADQCTVALLDGDMLHLKAKAGMSEASARNYAAQFPRPVNTASMFGRAILAREAVQTPDVLADPEHFSRTRVGGPDPEFRAIVAVPMLRAGTPIGAIALVRRMPGIYSATRMGLLETFAEQAVIAITSAETYRALQTRTADLQESLEYQTATSEVLKVISRSTFDLQPVLDTLVETAVHLCNADFGNIFRRESEGYRRASSFQLTTERQESIADRRDTHRVNRGSIVGRVVLEGGVVHVHDVASDPDYTVIDAIRLGKLRSSLGVPLMREGDPIGVITLGRHRVEPFTDRQIQLVSTFADQAVIAMENARLITEQREALEQQTATAEVLQVINASPGNLAPVFDALLEKAHRLCGAAHGALVLHDSDGETFRAVATHSYSGVFGEQLRQGYRGADNPITRSLIGGARFVHHPDLAQIDHPMVRASVELAGVRTGLYVPLRKDNVLLGMIYSARREIRPFSDKEIALVENFAAQAVIAMENARLLQELRQRTGDLEESLEYQTATSEVLKVISRSTFDLRPVFQTVAATAVRLCNADQAGVYLHQNGEYRWASGYSQLPEYERIEREVRIRPGTGTLVGRVALEGRAVHILDAWADTLYEAKEDARVGAIHTLLGVPLLRDGSPIGVIGLGRQKIEPFTERQIELVSTFAAQAVIAMENARLINEQREALERQTAVSEILGVVNSSLGDLGPVFDAILEKALALCGADRGIIRTYDGEAFHTGAMRGIPTEIAELMASPRRPPFTGMALGRLVAGESVVELEDITNQAGYRAGAPTLRAMGDTGGARTGLWIALRKDEALLGYFWIYRLEVRPFNRHQVALLQNFAAQAVIAMENARLLTELRHRTEELARRNSEYGERIEQQSATIDVLEAMSASSGDAQPVFQVIVERARAFCNADHANLALVDGDMLHVQATTIGNAVDLAQFPRPVDATSMFGRAILARDAVQTPDVWADPRHFLRTMSGGAMPRPRGFVAVPLLRAGAPVGAIVLARNTPGEFSATQVELLRTFAEQAVIAISSAETFKELQRRTADLTRSVAELQALEEVLRAVNSSLELETVLSTIISRAVQLSDADEGTIYEYDVSEQVFVPKSAFGMSAERVAALRERRIKLGQTHLGRSAILRAPVYVEDVQQDPSVPNAGDVLPGIHAVLAVPLLRNDTVIGGLVIRRRTEKGFAETIITLMQTFSSQAVLAIENARLFQEAGRARTAAETALVDLRRAQDRLVQSEKMASLGQLTAGIAHEIKNPLNFVNNFAALSVDLLSELNETAAPGFAALTEKQRAEVEEVSVMLTSNLEKITEHGRRADGIVKAMLEHSRGSSGERRAVDLNALIDEALNLAYHGARAQDQSFKITLERDFGEGIAPIEVNPQDITRVFLNLFSNGFYATTKRAREGGDTRFLPTLKVTTIDAGDAVEIRVRDNGTGIPADIRDKLFQPFFTTKPTGEGTGLGLSITYDIVTQQHGGSITVDSEVGDYSELTIRLPRNP